MTSNIRIQRICRYCGKEFTARTTVTAHCGDECSKKAYKARMKDKKMENSRMETQKIKNKSIEELQAKEFLSVLEACKLIGISRRTLYRMIEKQNLSIGKAGRRTIIKKTDLEQAVFSKEMNKK